MVRVRLLVNGFLPKTTMASPYLDCEEIIALSLQGGYSNTPTLTEQSSAFLLSACTYLRERWLWQNPINPIDDTTYQKILDIVEQAEYDLMTNLLVGSLISFVHERMDDNLLLMDGSIYPVSAYPELASHVPASWIVAGDILLPDMRERGLFGSPDIVSVGTFVGDNEVTLTEQQMPVHTHVQQPHSHGYILTTGVPTAAGLEPTLADLTTNAPSVTDPTVAVNDSAGGGLAHNNVPRSLQVFWYIVAR